jgi:hypothetical protein
MFPLSGLACSLAFSVTAIFQGKPCDTVNDIVWHGLEPLALEMDLYGGADHDVEATTAFGVLSEERAVSVTHAMVRQWLTSSNPGGTEELQQAYEDCLTIIERSRPDYATVNRNDYHARVLRQLAADSERLSREFRAEMLSRFKESILQKSYLNDHPMVRNWAVQAFHGLDQISLADRDAACNGFSVTMVSADRRLPAQCDMGGYAMRSWVSAGPGGRPAGGGEGDEEHVGLPALRAQLRQPQPDAHLRRPRRAGPALR